MNISFNVKITHIATAENLAALAHFAPITVPNLEHGYTNDGETLLDLVMGSAANFVVAYKDGDLNIYECNVALIPTNNTRGADFDAWVDAIKEELNSLGISESEVPDVRGTFAAFLINYVRYNLIEALVFDEDLQLLGDFAISLEDNDFDNAAFQNSIQIVVKEPEQPTRLTPEVPMLFDPSLFIDQCVENILEDLDASIDSSAEDEQLLY